MKKEPHVSDNPHWRYRIDTTQGSFWGYSSIMRFVDRIDTCEQRNSRHEHTNVLQKIGHLVDRSGNETLSDCAQGAYYNEATGELLKADNYAMPGF